MYCRTVNCPKYNWKEKNVPKDTCKEMDKTEGEMEMDGPTKSSVASIVETTGLPRLGIAIEGVNVIAKGLLE